MWQQLKHLVMIPWVYPLINMANRGANLCLWSLTEQPWTQSCLLHALYPFLNSEDNLMTKIFLGSYVAHLVNISPPILLPNSRGLSDWHSLTSPHSSVEQYLWLSSFGSFLHLAFAICFFFNSPVLIIPSSAFFFLNSSSQSSLYKKLPILYGTVQLLLPECSSRVSAISN